MSREGQPGHSSEPGLDLEKKERTEFEEAPEESFAMDTVGEGEGGGDLDREIDIHTAKKKDKKAQPRGLINRAKGLARVAAIATAATIGGKFAYDSYEQGQKDDQPVAVLGTEFTRDQFTFDSFGDKKIVLSAEQAAEVLKNPELLRGKSWQADALYWLADHYPQEAISYAVNYFSYLGSNQGNFEKIISGWAKWYPEFFLKHFGENKKLPGMEKVFLEEALPKLQQRYSFNLVEHFSSYQDCKGANDILANAVSHLSPQEFLETADICRHLPDSDKFFRSALLALEGNSDGLLIQYGGKYAEYAGGEDVLRRAVEREAKEGRESVLQFAEVFANKPWARTHVSAVAKEHPYWR
ncbi:MAG: hypothetical protein AAB408_05075 [Patescibacteria group bacterium]